MVNQNIITFAQLTAPGSTSATTVTAYKNYTLQYKVASIDTNVVVRLEGSLDGTNWINLDSDGDTTITANGTYGFKLSNTPLAQIRFTFVSEAGGTAATIDAVLMTND